VFRPVNRGGQVQAVALSEKVVWQLLQGYAAAAGVPGICAARPSSQLRENVSGRRRRVGANPVATRARLGSNHATVPRNEAHIHTLAA
jgi:hypothetical protein